MIIIGYIGALLIGLVLGLIGGGGSILTVPIFVYFLEIDPILATAYSLFVVGSTALVGAFRNYQNNLIDFKIGFVFAVPSFIGVYIARAYLIDSIPDQIFFLSKETAIMLFFAFIMFIASYFMINGYSENVSRKEKKNNNLILTIEGFVVGVLTGIVGAGGGFLIIPALVLFANLPMKKAVATSLMIIAIKSLFGFLGDVGNDNMNFDWALLSLFTTLSIVGIFFGTFLAKFINGNNLKKGFGWFVMLMAFIILFKEII